MFPMNKSVDSEASRLESVLDVFEVDARPVRARYRKLIQESPSAPWLREGGWRAISIGRFQKQLGVVVFIPESMKSPHFDEPRSFARLNGEIALLLSPGTTSVKVSGICEPGTPFSAEIPIVDIEAAASDA